MSTKPQSVESRLARLERQNRRLRAGIFGLAGVMVAGVAVGWSASQAVPDFIEARRLLVVNEDGKNVAGLEADADGGVVWVRHHEYEKTVVGLSAIEEGGSVWVRNRDGGQVVALGANANGGGVAFHNGDGKQAVALGAHAAGGVVAVHNRDGEVAVILGSNEDGGAYEFKKP